MIGRHVVDVFIYVNIYKQEPISRAPDIRDQFFWCAIINLRTTFLCLPGFVDKRCSSVVTYTQVIFHIL